MTTKHPARSARMMAGVASVAAFVGAAIAIATHGHNGTTQPAGAAQTPVTTPTTSQTQAPSANSDDGNWGATSPDDGQFGNDPWGSNGQNGQSTQGSPTFGGPSHSQSGGS